MFTELLTWEFSAIDGNTAYFYFKDTKTNSLMCVEYWVDEEEVAPLWEKYTPNGELIEDGGGRLSDAEIAYYTKVCEECLAKES